jgi:membrane protein DedA with SNARE-associated domain
MIENLIQWAGEFISPHPYAYLFIGMLLAGETVLLPAIYFSLSGMLRIEAVVAISIISNIISDAVWYYIGLHIKERFFKKLVGEKIKALKNKLEGAFNRHGAKMLFLSKFVYGTRVAAQILSGAHRMPLLRYFVTNILGVFCLTIIIVILAYVIDFSVEGLAGTIRRAEITFLILVAIVGVLHVILGMYFKKRWFKKRKS